MKNPSLDIVDLSFFIDKSIYIFFSMTIETQHMLFAPQHVQLEFIAVRSCKGKTETNQSRSQ